MCVRLYSTGISRDDPLTNNGRNTITSPLRSSGSPGPSRSRGMTVGPEGSEFAPEDGVGDGGPDVRTGWVLMPEARWASRPSKRVMSEVVTLLSVITIPRDVRPDRERIEPFVTAEEAMEEAEEGSTLLFNVVGTATTREINVRYMATKMAEGNMVIVECG